MRVMMVVRDLYIMQRPMLAKLSIQFNNNNDL
jgi:hypothetical protein